MSLAQPHLDHDQTRWFLGTAIKFLVSAREGNDGICVVEHHMPHGDSAPLHLHRNEDEVFVVLHGAVRLEVGGHTQHLDTGDVALAPKGVPHGYIVESDGARVLTITRGHDFETMLRTLSRPANRPGLPPQTPPSAELLAKVAEVCRQNGIDLVGPPLAASRTM
jgi:quercetin dioxygenase-like cupin family protein